MRAARLVMQDSLLRNSVFIMSTTVANSVFGFLFWLLAARWFRADAVGLAAGVIAAGTIIVLIAGLGVGGTLIHALPTTSKPREWSLTFWAGMATAVTIGSASILVALLALPALDGQFDVLRAPGFASVFTVGTLAMVCGSILDYAFLAERSAGRMFVRNAVAAFCKVALLLTLLLALGQNADVVVGSWAGASLVGLVVGAGLLLSRLQVMRPAGPRLLRLRAVELRSHFAGQQMIGIGGALLPYVLSVIVTVRLDSSDNAYFFTTWMMAGVFLIIAPAVSLSLFAEGAHDRRGLRRKAGSALAFIAAILIPGAIAIFVFGRVLLSAFGPAYADSATDLLDIVLLAAFPDAVTNVYVAVLRVQGRLVTAALLNVGMGVGTVALAWILLPVLGITAVGWAFLIAQVCGCVVVGIDVLRLGALRANDHRTYRGIA